MNLRESIKRILREELTPSARRRINFGNIDSILKKQRIGSFQKDQPIDSSINRTIHLTMYDVMPREFEDNDEEYFKVWDGIKKYLKDTYSDELTQYFEKRQRDADEDKNPLGIKYVFIKHDKPYNTSSGWRGFADGFDSFDEMITKYGSYVDVDWDEIKRKLDTINDYPVETFNNTRNSYPLRISNIGDEGNNWGYNFSIIKQIPKDNLGKFKNIQTEGELTERCWTGYTQKGMKTMFGKRYPNCVKIKKK
jgi:hypothetical protein